MGVATWGMRERALAACLAFSLSLSLGAAAPSSPPDVLLITVDTLRADHLGTYGESDPVSPRIDALATQSVVFERAIAAAGRTVPAHASIMTSQYTRGHSVGHLNGKTRLEGIETLAGHFQAAGYETAAFVGNILLSKTTGIAAGFDSFDTEMGSRELNRRHVVERLAPATTDRALAWLEARGNKPIFLWVHYQDPHGPYTPPKEDGDLFVSELDPAEPKLQRGANNRGEGGIPPYQQLPGRRYRSEYISQYKGEIRFADREIGRLIEGVRARETGEVAKPRSPLLPGSGGPIILLTADHGESLGENGRYFVHTTSTTPDVSHVPLILHAPGLAPARSAKLVSHVDILPTLLQLAGLEVPESAQGIELGPLLRSGASAPDRFVYCDNGDELGAYRGEEFFQVAGVESAWLTEGATETRIQPVWRRFTWAPREGWKQPERARRRLPREIQRYLATAEPMVHLPPANPELIRQLRALGYAEPAESDETAEFDKSDGSGDSVDSVAP